VTDGQTDRQTDRHRVTAIASHGNELDYTQKNVVGSCSAAAVSATPHWHKFHGKREGVFHGGRNLCSTLGSVCSAATESSVAKTTDEHTNKQMDIAIA